MSTYEGAVQFKRHMPNPWPPKDPDRLYGGPVNGVEVEIIAIPEGRIFIDVFLPDGSALHSFKSARLDVTGKGQHWIGVSWGSLGLVTIMDGVPLPPGGDDKYIYSFDATPRQALSEIPSIYHPDARVACDYWMKIRANRFSQPAPKRLKFIREQKTSTEEAEDLTNAMHSLHMLCGLVRSGHYYLVGHLAGELRALMYWEKESDRKENYDPLLFRLAALANEPLPVFGRKEIAEVTRQPNMDQFFTGNAAEIHQESSDKVLMDVQEWLTTTALYLWHDSRWQPISIKDYVSETANALGSSHYDASVSRFLKVYKESRATQGNLHQLFLLNIAETALAMSDYVLTSLQKQGKIS